MNKARKRIIAGNEVSELLTLSLGGVPQKVLIEGKKKSLLVNGQILHDIMINDSVYGALEQSKMSKKDLGRMPASPGIPSPWTI